MEGNQMKMREALNNIGNAAAWVAENCNDQQAATYMNDILAMIQAALSEPARQCDVGTPAEQERRYKATGEVYHTLTLTNALAWAQTPYEEEGAVR